MLAYPMHHQPLDWQVFILSTLVLVLLMIASPVMLPPCHEHVKPRTVQLKRSRSQVVHAVTHATARIGLT